MMRLGRALFSSAVLILVASTADQASASSEWVARIPNGSVNSCNTCHIGIPSPVNPFGQDFDQASRVWSLVLAGDDSDGDGFSNGTELQDPAGTWTQGQPAPGDPSLVSNPGDASSTDVAGTTWGRIKTTFQS